MKHIGALIKLFDLRFYMVNLIIDTDIGNDCDDAAAIALAARYHREGKCNFLCCTVSVSDVYAPDCIDAITEQYGINVEIGVYRGGGFKSAPTAYCRAVAERFGAVRGKAREEAVHLLRRRLSASDDKSITLVCIGPLNNICALLESGADKFGGTGVELVAKKVEKVVVMGGMFGKKCAYFEGKVSTAEYNIVSSVPDAIRTVSLCPVEMVFSDFLLGAEVITLAHLAQRAQTDAVGYAYELFCGAGNGRPSWDPITVMYAVEGGAGVLCCSPRGNVTVNDAGETHFAQDPSGLHSYLIAECDSTALAQKLDSLFL